MSTRWLEAVHPRQSWDDYFLTIAAAAATRSDCTHRRVGAVIARDHRIRSTGYNGLPPHLGSCDAGVGSAGSAAALRAPHEECIAVHAEANALLSAHPDDRARATLYSTAAPCFACAKLIATSGVGEVVAAGGRYDGWEDTRRFLMDCELRVRVLDGHEHAVALPLRA